MARLRVLSWNVDSRPTGSLDAKLELLRAVEPDLVLLQELGRSVFRALMPHPGTLERASRHRMFAWGALSTDLSTPRGSELRLGCAVLGGTRTALLKADVLDSAPFAVAEPVRAGFLQRTVAARVAVAGGRQLTACSFQARQTTSRSAGPRRRSFHAGIARWLAVSSGPAVFGIDTTGPGCDVEPGADPLLGPNAGHGLRDVSGTCNNARPVGAGGLDQIWASPELQVLDVRYLHEEAFAAGSDHAVVLTDFAL